jgi:hypothetical protein
MGSNLGAEDKKMGARDKRSCLLAGWLAGSMLILSLTSSPDVTYWKDEEEDKKWGNSWEEEKEVKEEKLEEELEGSRSLAGKRRRFARFHPQGRRRKWERERERERER